MRVQKEDCNLHFVDGMVFSTELDENLNEHSEYTTHINGGNPPKVTVHVVRTVFKFLVVVVTN